MNFLLKDRFGFRKLNKAELAIVGDVIIKFNKGGPGNVAFYYTDVLVKAAEWAKPKLNPAGLDLLNGALKKLGLD